MQVPNKSKLQEEYELKEKERQEKELAEKMRMIRYKNRKNVDELIHPLLNLELINMFALDFEDSDPKWNNGYFPVLPAKFENNEEYFEKWLKLF